MEHNTTTTDPEYISDIMERIYRLHESLDAGTLDDYDQKELERLTSEYAAPTNTLSK